MECIVSTSPDMEATKAFLAKGSKGGEATGTLHIIDKGWGYDIQPYSLFSDEEEILLEPERQVPGGFGDQSRAHNHQPRDAGYTAVSSQGVWGWWVQMKKERSTISLFSTFFQLFPEILDFKS